MEGLEALSIRNFVFEESKFKKRLKEALKRLNVEILFSDVERGYVVVSVMLRKGESAEDLLEEVRKEICMVDGLKEWRMVSAWVYTGNNEAVAAYTRRV